MTITLVFSLFLQAIAVILLRRRLGGNWLISPVSLLTIVAVIYTGISDIFLQIPSVRVWDAYRVGIRPHDVDMATLYMSIGLLALVVSYLITGPKFKLEVLPRTIVNRLDQQLDWRLLGASCLPVAV